MRFKTLFAVCALFGSLFQSSPSLSETLRTAWLGEHEAFLTWYAKEKGWDKEAGLDIIMLRFDSGKSLIETSGPTIGPSPVAGRFPPCRPP